MSGIALHREHGFSRAGPPPRFPLVKPRWLAPATTVAVVAAHVCVAVLLVTASIEKYVPLESVSVDLIPQGDMFESENAEATDNLSPPENIEQPDMAIPPPMVMAPDATPLPAKKEFVEPRKRVVERQQVVQAKERHEAQERHRLGLEEGRARSGGVSRAAYAALLAASIRRHIPNTSSLNAGSAFCSFHVTASGAMSGVSCSGTSPAHVGLLRGAISSTHAPPPPGGGFFARQGIRTH